MVRFRVCVCAGQPLGIQWSHVNSQALYDDPGDRASGKPLQDLVKPFRTANHLFAHGQMRFSEQEANHSFKSLLAPTLAVPMKVHCKNFRSDVPTKHAVECCVLASKGWLNRACGCHRTAIASVRIAGGGVTTRTTQQTCRSAETKTGAQSIC